MSGVSYAFVYKGSGEWKVSAPDEWELDVIQLEGDEKTVGHHKIDGSICKVLQANDGKLLAINK